MLGIFIDSLGETVEILLLEMLENGSDGIHRSSCTHSHSILEFSNGFLWSFIEGGGCLNHGRGFCSLNDCLGGGCIKLGGGICGRNPPPCPQGDIAFSWFSHGDGKRFGCAWEPRIDGNGGGRDAQGSVTGRLTFGLSKRLVLKFGSRVLSKHFFLLGTGLFGFFPAVPLFPEGRIP